jgi:hypothetical protein
MAKHSTTKKGVNITNTRQKKKKKAHNWHILGVDCSQSSEILEAQYTLNEQMLGTKGLSTAQFSAMPVLETMY